MAEDQDRADRIRALKQERPDLTWRRIADYVGVSERAATNWQRKGGIEHANAEKLARLFEVDVDYIWRGVETNTPSPFAGRDDLADHLASIDQRLERIEALLADRSTATDDDGWAERVVAVVRRELRDERQSPAPAPRKRAASGTRQG